MPPDETTDVKPGAESSAATNDVKPTFDTTANAMIEALTKDSSPEENESDVLKKNTTEEEKESSAVEEADATVDKAKEKTEQEETDKKDKETEDEEVTGETKVDDKSTDESKVAETVPYVRFKEVNEKAQRFEKLAQDHESLITYCQQSQISPEQFRGTLEILSLANTNPTEAIKRTEAFLEQLKVSAGTGLPADLAKEVEEARQEVELGNISKERFAVVESRMKELAKARFQHSSLEQQNRFAQLQAQQAEGQQLTGALAAWAESKKTLDPSFKPSADPAKPGKFEDFLAKNVYLWTLNPPKSPAEAVALADKALAEVDSMVKRYQPSPKPRKAPLSTGHSRSTESEQPKSMDDVINRVAKKHGYSV